MLAGPLPTAALGPFEGDERRVLHALRDAGWYVADDISIDGIDIDHVAIGPAGVLAVQVMWTNRPDPRGKPSIRARVAAERLRRTLAAKEVRVEVVPAVLAFGPGLTEEPAGVKVVDSVAILFGDQSGRWMAELGRRHLLTETTLEAVRSAVAELREARGAASAAPAADSPEAYGRSLVAVW
ncbi:MAG: NERD domain-containing protein [Actinobacteria bacterium]|nr:NERD domain-containing protein [Actinomycetota bacterium]